jgi:predicted O-methyltransferase YrrM
MQHQPKRFYEDNTASSQALLSHDLMLSPNVIREVFALNEVLAATGEKIEGNICYSDQLLPEQYKNVAPTSDRDYVVKRLNLATLSRRHSTMLEIGLNGGHSALLCLLANPALHFFAVDIGWHIYTHRAAEFLRARFGRRFNFWPGDSREVLPRIALERPNLKFDLVHIDGGHAPELAFADISNGLRVAAKGADFIVDDINHPPLGDVLEQICNLGYLGPLDDTSGLYEAVLHRIVRVS